MTYAWNDRPPPSSEQFLRRALEEHAAVQEFQQDKKLPQLWHVTRAGMDPVTFYFQNVYILGLADYEAIRHAHPDVRCIVTVGDWNSFSNDAADRARQDGVALFTTRGLLGALYKDGKAFYSHRPRE